MATVLAVALTVAIIAATLALAACMRSSQITQQEEAARKLAAHDEEQADARRSE